LPTIAGPGPEATPPGSGPMPAVAVAADRPRAGRALPSPPPGGPALAGPPSVVPRPVSPALHGQPPAGPATGGWGSAGERSTGLAAIGLASADPVSGGRELAGQDPVGWPQPSPDAPRRAVRAASGHIASSDDLGLAAGEPTAGESASAATQLPSHVTQPNSPQSYRRPTAAGSAPAPRGRHAEPAQAPQALDPRAQFPETPFLETPFPDAQFPDAQFPDAEREDRDASWPSDFAPAAGAADPAGEW
jgi:hypothetical protein